MSTRPITTMHTSTIIFKSSSSTHLIMPHLTIRSIRTLYSPITTQATSTLVRPTALPTSMNSKQAQSTSDSSSPTIPATAFWAVLAALILVLVLLALAFPIWYCFRRRHKTRTIPPLPTPASWPSSSQWSTFTHANHSHLSHISPTQMQQLQILNQLQNSAAVAPSQDPNRRTLLARLAALNNPSILGAVPEDSTIMTSSDVYPGKNGRQVVNQHWAKIKEKRLQEARGRGEVCEMEIAGDVGKEKKVRFREREWAVLASGWGRE
ncbi:MAG: hypothetical protein Q9221_008918 [Calogaya cf. arnoldii]